MSVDWERRAEILREDKPVPCYEGQWTVHEPHTYEVQMQNWLGGGARTVRCPGKTE